MNVCMCVCAQNEYIYIYNTHIYVYISKFCNCRKFQSFSFFKLSTVNPSTGMFQRKFLINYIHRLKQLEKTACSAHLFLIVLCPRKLYKMKNSSKSPGSVAAYCSYWRMHGASDSSLWESAIWILSEKKVLESNRKISKRGQKVGHAGTHNRLAENEEWVLRELSFHQSSSKDRGGQIAFSKKKEYVTPNLIFLIEKIIEIQMFIWPTYVPFKKTLC